MENPKPIHILNAIEVRIIGALIEKSKTTPDYYPMSINAIVNACNQKTSRNPVVQYDEETVTLTLNSLKIKGLVSTVSGAGTRSLKYKHNLAIVYPLLPEEVSILCLLFLRGPLTPGEINTYAARMYEFEHLEQINTILQKLAADEPAYVKQLARKPGQKETRFMHLFASEEIAEEPEENSAAAVNGHDELEQRVARLEHEVAELKEIVNLLMDR